MHMVTPRRHLAIAASLAFLAGCSTTSRQSDPATEALASPPQSVAAPALHGAGTEARYCPTVTLREGTAILRKTSGEAVDYVASIVDTSRDCEIVDGKLRMKIGILGRLTPGPVAQNRTVALPIRIAIIRDQAVTYSKLGKLNVPVVKDAGAKTFTYVDNAISLDQPTKQNITIYAGFDEGGAQ